MAPLRRSLAVGAKGIFDVICAAIGIGDDTDNLAMFAAREGDEVSLFQGLDFLPATKRTLLNLMG